MKDERIVAIIVGLCIVGILCIWSYLMPEDHLGEVLKIVNDAIIFILGGVFGIVGFERSKK